ncbi:hypothetical protein RJ55_00229 [Drechmeria coniospora]|nr:hypothetical protein RJ55_00229 [Drechmeria coniospora]
MVRAIVAAHPDVKWNYKEIAACYGSDMTEHALNHRFRRLRAQAAIVREGRQLGFDSKNLPASEELPIKLEDVDRNNIAKYFGQSTADGIQFQFRAIKRDADQLRQVEASGGDVLNCLNGSVGSAATTPSKLQTPSRRGASSGTGTSRKKRTLGRVYLKKEDSDDDLDNSDFGHDSGRDEHTPSKRSKTMAASAKKATPRRAAQMASDTIAADAAAQRQGSESPAPLQEPTAAKSLFGPFDAQSAAQSAAQSGPAALPTGFAANGSDTYMTSFRESLYHDDSGTVDDEYGDGEI